MLKPEDVERAVDLQQRSYALLRWLADAVDRGTLTFTAAHQFASLPEAAHHWLDRNYETLPHAAQPPRADLRAFANLFASYLETSFDLVEAPGQHKYSPDAHCFCPMCSWLVAAPRLRTKKLTRGDKDRARELQVDALRAIALDLGVDLSDHVVAELQSRPDIYEATAIVAYALEMQRRMNDAGVGPAGLALWRAFAWTREGSPKKGFSLRAQAILDAEATIANAMSAYHAPSHVALSTPADALRLLASLGASSWLVRHHELVVEAAQLLCERIARAFSLQFDRRLVLLGAALHDAGKIVHPAEMREPGIAHEAAGERLLLDRGVAADVSRFCVTHAAWNDERCTFEDLLVALADKLWKGKRDEDLELALSDHIAAHAGGERWSVMSRVDAICEEIAASGTERLARSDT
jgi:hypothetical protein